MSGPNSGPTGPTFKGQWTKPITWVDEEWRSDNVQVPASSSVAPTATGFFCTAVAKGSEIYLRFLRNPFFVLGILAAIVLLAVWLSRRTNWSPALPYPIRQRRDAGEIYRSGFRVYRTRRVLFIGIGLMAIPLGALAAIAQHLLFGVTGLASLTDVAVADPVVGAFAASLFGALHHADRRHARVRGVRRGARPDRRRRAARRARRLPRHRPGTAPARMGHAPHDDCRGRSLSSR